jgi:penicillin-insensitive murein endopeptidase
MTVRAHLVLLLGCAALAAGAATATAAPTKKPAVIHASAPLPPAKPMSAEMKREQVTPAKQLFGEKKLPSLGKAAAIGYYPRGCLQGGVALPVNGPTWQVMRLSRNRNWGHPSLVRFLERFAPAAAKATGWRGVLVGDMAQPRGGPAVSDHMSHQIGLDVDIWFMPMPDHTLSPEEREKIAAIDVVAADRKTVDPVKWTPATAAFIRTAAEQPEVERVLVNAAIKKELCRMEGKQHFAWMSKVRPWYGHADHIHVRLKCPADSPQCRAQPPVPAGDGCSDKELAFWFKDSILHPVIKPDGKKAKPLMMADLPPACEAVLKAPDKASVAAGAK